jgi:hypothetical protein
VSPLPYTIRFIVDGVPADSAGDGNVDSDDLLNLANRHGTSLEKTPRTEPPN